RIRSSVWRESREPDVIVTEIFVDGRLLVDFKQSTLSTSLVALQRSIDEDGEFFFVTCTCGIPMCAGIREGVRVTRAHNRVHWVVRGLGDTQTFYFDAEEYGAAIKWGIKQFQQIMREKRLEAYPPINERLLDRD
ncbi:MAG: hypothetical protein PVG11_02310, partial [Anaerolineae bacterium]